MKRQKGTPEGVAAEATKKKEEGAEEKTAEEVVVEEGIQPTEEVAEEVAELANLWSWVDEEIRWAISWIPFWEVEATGDAYDDLYGDVLWDYDIWDLKSIRNTPPNP